MFARALLVATGALLLLAQAPSRGAIDPERQSEKDWVDGRWSQTDVGPFLASTIQLPNGAVAKGLSIRVGELPQATVCYDTGAGLLRAGWTGGFLKLDPARYGLIRAPKVSGELKFLGPARRAGQESVFEYSGMRLNANRVILSWRTGNTTIRESPWYENVDDTDVFTRTLELPEGDPLKLTLLDTRKATPKLQQLGATQAAVFESDSGVICVAWIGDPGPQLELNEGRIDLRVPSRNRTTTGRVVICAGKNAAPFEKILSHLAPAAELAGLSVAGPARWLPEIVTRGQRGLGTDIFAVDSLAVPYDNPWKALMFLSGVDFLSNGTAFVSSIHGDVWRVSGIDESLRALRWKRFATGLFQALGLRVVNGKIFVLGRDQITELVDENGDGEADVYNNFCNSIDTSTGGHEYVTCLETDSAGNFYYVDPRGVHRVSADGKHKETIATGWRNPNGLGVGPHGVITVAPQQGEWTPSSAICEVRAGAYYGYGGPRITAGRALGYDEPLCWIPHSADNSSGSQVWVPQDHWGPLAGQMLHLVWGRCSMMLVLRDETGSEPHGATIPLPGRFLSGPMRGTFSPYDGHMYVAGCTGWQTSAVKDGCLDRVRYTGKTVYLPVAFHVETNGIALTLSQPLTADTAGDTGSYAVSQWNYKYTKEYGSADWSVADSSKKGRDTVDIKTAKLSPDGLKVFLEIPELRPVMQMEIKYNLNATSGQKVKGVLYTTIHERRTVQSAAASAK